jgi:hypothetical protein
MSRDVGVSLTEVSEEFVDLPETRFAEEPDRIGRDPVDDVFSVRVECPDLDIGYIELVTESIIEFLPAEPAVREDENLLRWHIFLDEVRDACEQRECLARSGPGDDSVVLLVPDDGTSLSLVQRLVGRPELVEYLALLLDELLVVRLDMRLDVTDRRPTLFESLDVSRRDSLA